MGSECDAEYSVCTEYIPVLVRTLHSGVNGAQTALLEYSVHGYQRLYGVDHRHLSAVNLAGSGVL